MRSLATRILLPACGLLLIGLAPQARSMPRLMDLYNAHPRALAQNRDKCVICHTNANGSGRLTAFGEKYEHAGLEFTDGLIKEYPNLFSGAGSAEGGSAGAQAPVNPGPPSEAKGAPEAAPAWTVAAYYRAECTKCHGKLGDGDPLQGVPAWATKQWLATRAPQKDELVNIILNGKEKMIGHAGKINKDQAIELYLFIVEIAKKNS